MDNWRLNHLKGLHEEDPADEFVMYALAQEYFKLEQLEKAQAFFTKLMNANEDYVGLYYHLGALYIELEDEATALEIYQSGIKIARKLNDQHALSELMNAKTNLELGV